MPRPDGCKCHWEVGDSPCPVHSDACAVCGEDDCGSVMVNDTDEARAEHEPPYPADAAIKQERPS